MFGVLTIAAPLFAFSSVIRNSNPQLEHRYWYWIFRGWGFFAHPGSHMLCQVTPRPCTQLPATWLWVEMGSCYYIKSWNRPQLTAVYPLNLPLEVGSLHQTAEFQSNYIRQILPVQLLSRWGEIFLAHLAVPSSRILFNDLDFFFF